MQCQKNINSEEQKDLEKKKHRPAWTDTGHKIRR